MYTCFQNNIHLLFLPPYTLHVLQPLDLLVFLLLKSYYRTAVGFLGILTDSSLIGKQNFLSCYSKARKEALLAQNIKARQKASDLWPKSMAKPLISPLLLKNSNSRASTLDTSQSSFRPLLNNTLLVLLSTPRKSVEIKA